MIAAPYASRLLVGLDGRRSDAHFIRYAAMVARLFGPVRAGKAIPDAADREVRFVYLLPGRSWPNRLTSTPRQELRDRVNRYFPTSDEYDCFGTGAVVIATKGPVVGYDVLKGRSVARLAAMASDFESDLLLLSRSSAPASDCARVATTAKCPVWIVPPDWAPVTRRLLLPSDLSDRSLQALRTAAAVCGQTRNAKCYLLHVVRTGSRFGGESARRTAVLACEQLLRRAGVDRDAFEPVVVEGMEVAREVDRAVERYGIDLVVMSSRRRTAAGRWLCPSQSDLAVRRCRAAFLVLRSGGRPVGFFRGLSESLFREPDPHFA